MEVTGVFAGGVEIVDNVELGDAAQRTGWGQHRRSDAEGGWHVSTLHTPSTARDISRIMRASSRYLLVFTSS
jgi:hypothetical protein